ncbi:MAG: hypothetical protein HYZ53_11595 [Planctomycetes bacterium]|nr:hypothetical protein [Planctomycetota bacterium]
MKATELWDTVIWLINILLALAIMAFSFLFILIPSQRVDGLVSIEKLRASTSGDDDIPETPRREADWFRSTWESRFSQPEAPPPERPVVTPGKVYGYLGQMGKDGAILEVKASKEQKVYQVGQRTEPEGFLIVENLSNGVWIEYKDGAGKPARIFLNEKGETGAAGPAAGAGSAAPAGAAQGSAPAPAPAGGRGAAAAPGGGGGVPAGAGGGAAAAPPEGGVTVDPQDPNHFLVAAAQREFVFENEERLSKEVELFPYAPDGKPQGLRIKGMVADAQAQKFGLKVEDIVKKVNGTAVDSLTKIPELFRDQNLRAQTSFVVELERAGRTVELRFDIR